MDAGAIVLCGGRGSRMGGPKAWLPFGPERMLQRVVRLVGEVVAEVVVVAAPGQDLPDLPVGIRFARDASEGRGPMEGLAAGLVALGDGVRFAYVTGTDVPFLVPGWISRLRTLIGDADLAIPRVGGRLQTLAALYRTATTLPAARRLLAEGRLRMTDLAAAVATREVRADELRDVDPNLDTLANLNTLDDYLAALRKAGLSEQLSGGLDPPWPGIRDGPS
jgi:molybdopterin-guanine dinucleotide biosynthesis protein A